MNETEKRIFIRDGLKWDTEKLQELYNSVSSSGINSVPIKRQILYKSPHARYALMEKNIVSGDISFTVYSETQAKNFIATNLPEKYEEYFGVIEEA